MRCNPCFIGSSRDYLERKVGGLKSLASGEAPFFPFKAKRINCIYGEMYNGFDRIVCRFVGHTLYPNLFSLRIVSDFKL